MTLKNYILGLSLVLFATLNLEAATYYVAPDGANDATGTFDDPFFLIQEAIDNCNSGNDTVYLKEGTYWQRFLISGKSGVYLSSLNPSNKSTISGSGVEGLHQITIENSDSIYIANLILRENYIQDAKTIYAYGEGNGLFIIDNEIFNGGWGNDPLQDPESFTPIRQAYAILVNGRTEAGIQNVYIGRNHIHDMVVGNSESLTLTGNTFDFLIEDNLIENVTNIGIDIAGHFSWAFPVELDQSFNQARSGRIRKNTVTNCRRPTMGNDPAGIYVDGGKDVIIDNNQSFNNGTGLSVGCENFDATASGVVVVNNLIYNNDKFGTVFGANAGDIENCTFRNNVLFNNGVYFDNSGSLSLQKSSNSNILNNIIYLTSEDYFGLSVFGFLINELLLDRNLFYSPAGLSSRVYAFSPAEGSTFADEEPFFADPLFISVDFAEPDFHLSEGSPAVDNGSEALTLIPAETDMDGVPRSIENIDIGAYESDFVSSTSDLVGADLVVYPNPCTHRIWLNSAESVQSLRLFSLDGMEVEITRSFSKGAMSIGMEHLPKGMFILDIEFETGSVQKRLLKL